MTPTDKINLEKLAEYAGGELEKSFSTPPGLFTSPDIHAKELEQIFAKDWLCPGMAAEIPNAGDYLTFDIGDQPVIIVRDRDMTIRTLSNVCRHRMMILLEGRGNRKTITCPYHAWTYDLKGGWLRGAAHMEKSYDFDKKKYCLPSYRTEIWNGWIYVTQNPDATPIAELLAPLHDIVDRYQMAGYIPVVHQDHEWDTNWKLLCENFMEGYHLPIAHKATVGAWFPVEETWFDAQVYEGFTYQTFSKKGDDVKYGNAHPDNSRLEGAWRHTSVLPNVYPTHMYVLAPDHLWYLSLRPNGVGKVKVRFGVAFW